MSESFLIRLLVAGFLGALIGLERDIHGRAAGLRTNLLVSLG
ncbi:MAG: MgtC/SapB family protein, partial [Spirochaetes bacterium]|nr:MgtC/SapB family protein [Spirochaetota bacterium]